MWEETRTKWHQEYNAGSGIWSGMEDQLQRLIKAVTDSSKAATQPIRESNHEVFGVLRDRLNSIFYIVSRKTSMRHVMQ